MGGVKIRRAVYMALLQLGHLEIQWVGESRPFETAKIWSLPFVSQTHL